jgi:hypothetical protein
MIPILDYLPSSVKRNQLPVGARFGYVADIDVLLGSKLGVETTLWLDPSAPAFQPIFGER